LRFDRPRRGHAGWKWICEHAGGRRTAMIIEDVVDIEAPLPVVWDVFSRLENWSEWNSVCGSCVLVEGEGFGRGACFSFTLRPYFVPIRITPRVTRCEPGREVVWEGKRLGVRARHRFRFEEAGPWVRLHSVEEFTGALLWLSHLLRVPARLHRLSGKLLREIKTQSERCAADRRQAGRSGSEAR
jgi:hypothetical protein